MDDADRVSFSKAASVRCDELRAKGNPIGLPTFLLGGAVFSTIASLVGRFFKWAFAEKGGAVG